MKLVYVPLRNNRTGDLEAIARVPEGSSASAVVNAANQVYPHHDDHLECKTGGVLSDAEAETLLEMKVCSFIDFSDPSCWEALKPMQGWRDMYGQPLVETDA